MGIERLAAGLVACSALSVCSFFHSCCLPHRNVPVVFFPKGDPNFIFVYLKLPVGTNVDYTDSITHQSGKPGV